MRIVRRYCALFVVSILAGKLIARVGQEAGPTFSGSANMERSGPSGGQGELP